MRRLLLIAAVLLAASCSSPQKKVFEQAKVDVQAFLDKGGDGYQGAVVTEIVRVDSPYTPFETLSALTLALVDYYSDLAERCKDLSETASDNLFALKKLAALDEFDKMDGYRKIQADIVQSLKEPFDAAEKNRIGVYAKVRINDESDTDAYFYYNTNQADIGHSSNGLFNQLGELFDIGEKIMRVQNTILNMD